jgi:quercetin dioxygenase-like cupin family protein
MIVAVSMLMQSPGKYASSVRQTTDPNLATPSGIRTFDLALEAHELALARNPERTGRTIARLDTLRLTLMSLKAGTIVKEHKTDHEISIQTVSGHVAIHTQLERVDLPTGRVAVLQRDVVHDIEARGDSAILITVCISSVASS